ncbi:MAG: methanogenesis marker 12 protein [Methanomicrobiales archaeon]|nr:methanogenesis marker 12 protein [Methanomicrobiales archaeon]
MFIGIDHGTTAIRFASETGEFKISRMKARDFSCSQLERLAPLEEIEGIAVCYSMGDGLTEIRPIGRVKNRGVISQKGAGEHVGGGTRVYDEIAASGLPAVVIPGLHRDSPTDRRFRVYSHQASPEKIGIAYEVVHDLGPDVVISDVSSNTVSLLVSQNRIVGAIDACIFAPGTTQGAIDVDAIRRIDEGRITANSAFQRAGVNYHLPPEDRIPALSLFSAMECAALQMLNPSSKVALTGSMAPFIAPEVKGLLRQNIAVYDEWCAARGLVRIAHDVFNGGRDILGIGVDL